MFKVEGYIITFTRIWHEVSVDSKGIHHRTGRYDTLCQIIHVTGNCCDTGYARLHPKDKPDKIVGKKVALHNAMCVNGGWRNKFWLKSRRTAIWEAFWAWVATWPNQ